MAIEADITVLMPVTDNMERTTLRYKGLFTELNESGYSAAMVSGHLRFDEQSAEFTESLIPQWQGDEFSLEQGGPLNGHVVRDLTMPSGDMPLYRSALHRLVHDPKFNAILRDKSLVYGLLPELHPLTYLATNTRELEDALHALPGSMAVAKPITGSQSEGVIIDEKQAVIEAVGKNAGSLLIAQEFIDTSQGIPELGIKGRHNLRVIMIGGEAIFGFGRLADDDKLLVSQDSFEHLQFHTPDALPDDIHAGVDTVRKAMATLPDGTNTIVAADFMRGTNVEGDDKLYLCELNRRPLRNSAFDGNSTGLLWAANQWDRAEASLLVRVVDAEQQNRQAK